MAIRCYLSALLVLLSLAASGDGHHHVPQPLRIFYKPPWACGGIDLSSLPTALRGTRFQHSCPKLLALSSLIASRCIALSTSRVFFCWQNPE
jgi:hypothetical protein